MSKIQKSIKRANLFQEKYNSFVTILNEAKQSNDNPDSLINGMPYAMKDNVSTSGILTTGSSNILKDYVPVYDATIYRKLNEAGAVMIGKTVLDELAMGGTGTTGHTGAVKNPWDALRIAGGSSAGSAAAVALDIVPFAIGTDTGDSIRKPAAFTGIVGYKPTYGLVSRYGVFPFASSMDHVGVFTRNVKDVAVLLDVLKGRDELDMTSYEDATCFNKELNADVSGMKVCTIKELNEALKEHKDIYESYLKTIESIKALGITVEEVSVKEELLKAVSPTYFAIACAEATSNNANLNGIIFGPRAEGDSIHEIMFNARTEGFSERIKRRFVLGSFILQKENQEKLFNNAKRARRLIVDEMNKLFVTYDAYILPGAESIAPKLEETDQASIGQGGILEQPLAIANFGGFPSITIPTDIVGQMPVGLNITGPVKEDLKVLKLALALEEKVNFKYLELEVQDV